MGNHQIPEKQWAQVWITIGCLVYGRWEILGDWEDWRTDRLQADPRTETRSRWSPRQHQIFRCLPYWPPRHKRRLALENQASLGRRPWGSRYRRRPWWACERHRDRRPRWCQGVQSASTLRGDESWLPDALSGSTVRAWPVTSANRWTNHFAPRRPCPAIPSMALSSNTVLPRLRTWPRSPKTCPSTPFRPSCAPVSRSTKGWRSLELDLDKRSLLSVLEVGSGLWHNNTQRRWAYESLLSMPETRRRRCARIWVLLRSSTFPNLPMWWRMSRLQRKTA